MKKSTYKFVLIYLMCIMQCNVLKSLCSCHYIYDNLKCSYQICEKKNVMQLNVYFLLHIQIL